MVRRHSSRRPSVWSRYRRVLQGPAWRFFLPAAAGRLGVAMTGLGLLSLLQAATGSLATAGAVTGAFALSEAAAGPQVARVIDRYGQQRPLLLLVLVHAVAVTALLGTAHLGTAHQDGTSTAALCLVAAVMGASLPQLGACSAARWTRLFAASPLLRTAFALEAVTNDVAFLLGPTVVVAAAVAWTPVAAVVLATGLVVCGSVLLAMVREERPRCDHHAPATEPEPELRPDLRPDLGPDLGPNLGPEAVPELVPGPGRRGLLRAPFVSVVVVNLGLGGVFGSLQVAVTASAAGAGRPGVAGALYSVLALGGLIGGFVFGAGAWRGSPPRQLLTAALCLFLAVSLLSAAPSLLWLAGAVLAAGLMVAPVMVLSGSMVHRLVDPTTITQALSWTASASAAGLAGAAATTGYLVDTTDARASFAVTVAAATTVLLAAAAAARTRQHPVGTPRRYLIVMRNVEGRWSRAL